MTVEDPISVIIELINGDEIDQLSLEQVDYVRKLLISKDRSQDEYKSILIKLLPILIGSLKTANGVGNFRIKCTDTISIWLLRTFQLCSKDLQFDAQVQKLLRKETLDFLFNYVIDYWNESGAPLSNSLKDLFTKLVSLLKHFPNSQNIFEAWLAQTLTIRKERRVLYYLIEVLSRLVNDPTFVLSHDPEFIETSLELISTNALGNPIGKALASIYKKLYITEEQSGVWVSTYWGPIRDGLRNHELRTGVQSNLLPHLFKLSPSAFRLIVQEFKSDQELFISLLGIGQQLAIEEDPYPQLINREFVESLLVNDSYKVTMFQILTYSQKGSKPVTKDTLDIIKANAELFFVDTEVETRNEFISLFKQFLFRLKDGSYAQYRDAIKLTKKDSTIFAKEIEEKLYQVDESEHFVHWLVEFVKDQIRPGSQYQRLITGLKILQQLLESNIDPNVFFKVSINYPFQVSLFDEELVSLLFGNCLSSYDDIREIASSLLLLSKTVLDETTKSSLITKGFDLLNDYGSSESGAKIIQLCYQLFKDVNIFNKLVSKIPLLDDVAEAVKNPVDGYFRALQLILPSLKPSEVPHETLISLAEKSWEVAKAILSHDSPEGCDEYGVGSAQLVLSYGWRSTKESTLLIQQLLNFDLPDNLLIRIGNITLDQLGTVRHRGAFSSVYPTFLKLANVCKKQMPHQNKTWLDHNISLIQTKTQLITRRSGGLPFLISAIVTIERDLFDYAFQRLLEIAREPVNEKDESEKMDIPQVHAFNCIKTLFIESQLADSCAPYVYSGLQLALSTFSSKIWSVRNCSIMLFTALQNRLFGRKKMSARVFFSRFKGIKEILVEILESSVAKGNLETLFPVLTILSKLEATPGYDGLEEFQPLLRVCLQTKYWKIRESASRALPALVSDPLKESLSLLEDCSIKHQNKLHGHLLAIVTLDAISEELSLQIISKIDELLVKNPSFATRKAYVDALHFVSRYFHLDIETKALLKEVFLKENSTYEVDGSKQLFLKELLLLVIEDDQIKDIALSSVFFEVKLEAIKHFKIRNGSDPLLSKIAHNEDEWTYVRSKVIPLVNDFEIDKAFELATNQELYGEDIKCSAIEYLGTAVVNSFNDFERWYNLIITSSNEDEPFTVRYASLTSILRFLKVSDNAKVEWLAYEFLNDDDDDIRELASSYFSEGTVPWINRKRYTETHDAKVSLSDTLIHSIIMFNPQFELPTDDKKLFSIEKKNFYKNNIEAHSQYAHILERSWAYLEKKDTLLILEHFNRIKEHLLLQLTDLGTDGILGWSNEENIFEQISITLIYLKSLSINTEDLKDLFIKNKLHPSLQKLLT